MGKDSSARNNIEVGKAWEILAMPFNEKIGSEIEVSKMTSKVQKRERASSKGVAQNTGDTEYHGEGNADAEGNDDLNF